MDVNEIRVGQGVRLRQERKRLGLNQKDFGALGGVARLAQLQYEHGDRSPTAIYLEAIHRSKCDIYYIVTGNRSVDAYRTVDAQDIEQRAFAMVEEYVSALPEPKLGSKERYALFDAFRLQLIKHL